jgi:hypothetical protein
VTAIIRGLVVLILAISFAVCVDVLVVRWADHRWADRTPKPPSLEQQCLVQHGSWEVDGGGHCTFPFAGAH